MKKAYKDKLKPNDTKTAKTSLEKYRNNKLKERLLNWRISIVWEIGTKLSLLM